MITAPVTQINSDRCRFYSFDPEAKAGEHERCAFKGFNFECSKNCPYREECTFEIINGQWYCTAQRKELSEASNDGLPDQLP